jgi:hypothetical protein
MARDLKNKIRPNVGVARDLKRKIRLGVGEGRDLQKYIIECVGEIFIKYLTESVGDGGQLHKGIRRSMGEGSDRRNKFCFSYQCFNKLKLEYSNRKS